MLFSAVLHVIEFYLYLRKIKTFLIVFEIYAFVVFNDVVALLY